MILRLFIASVLLTASSRADYALEPAALATGGQSGASVDYTLDASSTPGGRGSSVDYAARSGFAGQLAEPDGIAITADPIAIAENATSQLSADLHFDDGTRLAMVPSALGWSVLSGPITGISPDGLATAAAVYQDTPGIIRGASGGFSAELDLSVIDRLRDNFGTYAADGLPDEWQVRYFGMGALKSGKYDDFDGDDVGNLIEFASGTDPSSAASGRQPLRFENGVLVSPGGPLVDFSPATNALPYRALFLRRKDSTIIYRPQFSRNLAAWSGATTPLEVLGDAGEFEVVGIRFPVLIGGLRSSSKFFRLDLTSTAE